MIPKFPEFKKLELSDKNEVDALIKDFPPYSDFNFAGTWSWDVRDGMQISVLNDNYVIRFLDYVTGEPFYTFLGLNEVDDTGKKLLDLSISEGLKPELKLIAEEVAQKLDTKIFKIKEDRDNFDYIYLLEKMSNFAGGDLKNKRNQVSRFLRKYSNAVVKILDLKDKDVQNSIKELYDSWLEDKINENSSYKEHEEHIVQNKFFTSSGFFNLILIGVFIDNNLIGFTLNEIKESNYTVSHLGKANKNYDGIYEFLMQNTAKILYLRNKKFINYEQDLGLDNLRKSKMQFKPDFFLKKYTIESCV